MQFCGLHYTYGLSDQTEVVLKSWDKTIYGDQIVKALRIGGYEKGAKEGHCKSIHTDGCEKSGLISDFFNRTKWIFFGSLHNF